MTPEEMAVELQRAWQEGYAEAALDAGRGHGPAAEAALTWAATVATRQFYALDAEQHPTTSRCLKNSIAWADEARRRGGGRVNVDRYITDEAVEAAYNAEWGGDDRAQIRVDLRAALPSILAVHRADVLREAAAYVDRLRRAGRDSGFLIVLANDLLRLADEAATS